MPYYVYILASRSRVLYVGVTNDLARRVEQHRQGEAEFTGRYRVNRLVYSESFEYVLEAIAREKQVKSWTRVKREALIVAANPEWEDLLPRPDPSLRSG